MRVGRRSTKKRIKQKWREERKRAEECTKKERIVKTRKNKRARERRKLTASHVRAFTDF